MRNRFQYLRPILDYLGLLAWVFGLLMLVPLAYELAAGDAVRNPMLAVGFGAPAVLALLFGVTLKRNLQFPPLDGRRAMLLTALGWIVVSAVGALPFWLGLRVSFWTRISRRSAASRPRASRCSRVWTSCPGASCSGGRSSSGLEGWGYWPSSWRSCTRAVPRTGSTAPRATRSSRRDPRPGSSTRCAFCGSSTRD